MTDQMQAQWDSEKRDSPYSTVADANDDSYCEVCEREVVYSVANVHGRCGCDEDGGGS